MSKCLPMSKIKDFWACQNSSEFWTLSEPEVLKQSKTSVFDETTPYRMWRHIVFLMSKCFIKLHTLVCSSTLSTSNLLKLQIAVQQIHWICLHPKALNKLRTLVRSETQGLFDITNNKLFCFANKPIAKAYNLVK